MSTAHIRITMEGPDPPGAFSLFVETHQVQYSIHIIIIYSMIDTWSGHYKQGQE